MGTSTTVVRADARGKTEFPWLASHHTFSFGSYQNPALSGFKSLRVLNDDVVAGGGGFDTHPHKNMEIVTYVLSGSLKHKDSLGTEQQLLPGEVQRMSAGTGILHGEWNGSATESVHFLQIWILPKTLNSKPRYEQRKITPQGKMTLMVSRDGRDDTLQVDQDCDLYQIRLAGGETLNLTPSSENEGGWLHLIEGSIKVMDPALGESPVLSAGDGIGFEGGTLALRATQRPVHALYMTLR